MGNARFGLDTEIAHGEVFRARYTGDDHDNNVEEHVTWSSVAMFLH
jgi:hypothetical protein